MQRNLEKWQLDYIREHINDFPRKDVAKMAGVKVATLYKYIKMFGGEKKPLITDFQKDEIARLYPKMSAKEISDKIGVSVSSVIWQAKKQNLSHNDETQRRININRASSLRRYWDKDKYAEKGRRQHRMHKTEQVRIMSGIPQVTKLRIRKLSPKALNAKMYLRKKYNYFYSSGEPFVLCYDGETRRAKRENYYAEKFGFSFVNA